MGIMLGSLYDALKQATGVPESAARAAAEEVAGYDARLASIDTRLTLLTWMVALLTTIAIGHFFLTWQILVRLPVRP